MNILKARRIRHFLRLTYPVRVWLADDGFVGNYPDLPEITLKDSDLQQLYSSLDQARREWITEQVLAGSSIALPNSYLGAVSTDDGTDEADGAERRQAVFS